MFVSSSNYLESIRDLISEGGDIRIAVAFWGRGADSLFTSQTFRSASIVCNLRSGATNPNEIANLLASAGIEVRQCDNLHAKVVAGQQRAVIGSANISSNGLNLECEELEGWEEAGILTRDPAVLADVHQWFDRLWGNSRSITERDLSEARTLWAGRRNSRLRVRRTRQRGLFRLESLLPHELLDRRCYVVISRHDCTEQARDAFRNWCGRNSVEIENPNQLPFYENWTDLPGEATLIDFWYGPRGGIRCTGLYRLLLEEDFQQADGTTGQIQICRQEEDTLFGYRFDARAFESAVRSSFGRIWEAARGDEGGRIIALSDLVVV